MNAIVFVNKIKFYLRRKLCIELRHIYEHLIDLVTGIVPLSE